MATVKNVLKVAEKHEVHILCSVKSRYISKFFTLLKKWNFLPSTSNNRHLQTPECENYAHIS